jgi:hypothetical protein
MILERTSKNNPLSNFLFFSHLFTLVVFLLVVVDMRVAYKIRLCNL